MEDGNNATNANVTTQLGDFFVYIANITRGIKIKSNLIFSVIWAHDA